MFLVIFTWFCGLFTDGALDGGWEVSNCMTGKQNNLLLTVTAMALAICGPTIPGMVAAVLVIPMSIPAYLGAISRWLMLYPAMTSALNPTASVMKVTAVAVLVPK